MHMYICRYHQYDPSLPLPPPPSSPSFSLLSLLQISEEFRELSRRLYERPNCIEDLTEQRDFVKTIPDLVTAHQNRIDQVMVDYDLLDDYYYTLSDEDFDNRCVFRVWDTCRYCSSCVYNRYMYV